MVPMEVFLEVVSIGVGAARPSPGSDTMAPCTRLILRILRLLWSPPRTAVVLGVAAISVPSK